MIEMIRNSILVVDDEKANLLLLSRILDEKYDVYTAKDGASAIKKAAELLPDLILLDIVMPDMSGYEVLDALKRQSVTRAIPVIFVTKLSSPDEEEKALSYNAVDYITKPFRPNIIKLRIRTQIRSVNQIRTIERLSMTDQLTEIPNRRSFDNRMNVEWRTSIRETSPIGILMLDIDRFKNYNDTYGHQQGDKVLYAVAKCIEKSLTRPRDFAARWGGEEFSALLPNTDLGGAEEVAERIRVNVEQLKIPCEKCPDGMASSVTISVGAASVIPDNDSSLDRFISLADNALYEAKRTGRNKVCLASE
ncbi:MAG: diguanylate cyclase [Chitinispirillales bacterium]|jgi:diguanylate cyclase (GGDEF)-like protein|nr:diguanylate cyclase [Chitinispirillales bacterium]